MKISSRIVTAALAGAMGLSFVAPMPARADGAASTRNIIFGAAAVGGTLLILNHNKKVHQKYAEYDQRQAATAAERNQAQAAYESERSAFDHEVAINGELKKEVAYQHNAVHQRDKQIASLEHSLVVAKYGREHRTAYVQRPTAPQAATSKNAPPRGADVAYGWGAY